MKVYLITALLIFNLPNLFAQTKWSVSTASISFSIKNAGLTVKGTLGGFVGDVLFDSKQPVGSIIKGSVKVNTLQTGNSTRDKHLQEQEYFDAKNYPDMIIASSFFGKSANGFKAYCKLTIKGTTKDIVIPFTWTEQNNKATMVGSFELNRLDYKIGEGSLILSDKVTVNINLNLEK